MAGRVPTAPYRRGGRTRTGPGRAHTRRCAPAGPQRLPRRGVHTDTRTCAPAGAGAVVSPRGPGPVRSTPPVPGPARAPGPGCRRRAARPWRAPPRRPPSGPPPVRCPYDPLPDEPQELVHQQRIGAAVPGVVLGGRDLVDLVRVRAVAGAPGVPDLHTAAGAVAEVLQPARVADDGVVAPVVGGEMALLVGGQHTVVEAHVEQGHVLDVDDGVERPLGVRGPAAVLGVPVVGLGLPRLAAVRVVAVDHQVAEGLDVLRVAAREPVQDVDVVGGLLEQQPGRVPAFGVPVLEVPVAAVADEVPDPDRLDLADGAVPDQVAHQSDDGHVAHVVADVEPGAGLVRRAQDRVAALDADVEGLLHEDRLARPERFAGQVGVGVVGGEDQDRVDVRGLDDRAVVTGQGRAGEGRGRLRTGARVRFRQRGDAGAGARPVGGAGE